MTPWNRPRKGQQLGFASSRWPARREKAAAYAFAQDTTHSSDRQLKAISTRSNASTGPAADGIEISHKRRSSRDLYDVAAWIQHIPTELEPVDLEGYNCAGISSEISPREWIPDELIEGKTASEWCAKPQGGKDANLTQPWWKTYISKSSDILGPLPHPVNVPNEDENAPGAVTDAGSTSSSKKEARRQWNKDSEGIDPGERNTNQLTRQLDITIRHAKMSDVPDITAIYSEYIKHSYICPEHVPFTDFQVRQHWLSIEDAKLPYLVADIPMEKASDVDQEKKRKQVIGFCHAGNYNEAEDMFFYTVEITVFVRKEYCRQSVGRYLMDRLLTLLDPTHLSCQGYNLKGRSTRYSSNEKREVRAVVYRIPYDADDDSSLRWQAAWLNRLGFDMAGNLDRIGTKLNCSVGIAIFVKRTGKAQL